MKHANAANAVDAEKLTIAAFIACTESRAG